LADKEEDRTCPHWLPAYSLRVASEVDREDRRLEGVPAGLPLLSEADDCMVECDEDQGQSC
jgi:hypothetical protein